MMEEVLNGHVSKGHHDRNAPKDGEPLTNSSEHVDNTVPKPSTLKGFATENFPMMEEVLNGGHKYNEASMDRANHPEKTNAYLVGGGIASLAAAVHLIQDAHVPASQIHILESSSVIGGSMDGTGNAQDGYRLRGGRMLNFSYFCLYDLLGTIPSLTDPAKMVMDEIKEFNTLPESKTHARARLVAKGAIGPEIVDVKQMGLTARDRRDLVYMTIEAEHKLGTKQIDECFEKSFFHTKFWYMWATM
jgi:oleate hydratase